MTGQLKNNRRLRIFTWHIHGSYLFYLSQGNFDLFIPVNKDKTEGYYGKGNTFPFGDNVYEIEESEVKFCVFDIILFQTDENYFSDQYQTLSAEQRELPRIYLEHDPPLGHSTNTLHPVSDPSVRLVHVTSFNELMWDNHGLKTTVIEHGVIVPEITDSDKIDRGIVVINHLSDRGRLLGADIFEKVRQVIPIDLVGMGTENYGIGEVLHPELPAFISRYRFFFNPIRYTSLGLAVCEAMMVGLPIVGMATTEMAVTIKNGHSGFVHTDIDYLIRQMKYLIDNPESAAEMGENARRTALDRFNINRFTSAWEDLFRQTLVN
ncbi:transferase [Pedobacter lusitanus]|uniref:Contig34, whole genome shotgun sequence n=2 Tax=Pedobacter lusitanus TaxID=1503925 RepID=A0A0D0GMR4_9SPHI|nr:transferase [Pedobacter lusitanus]